MGIYRSYSNSLLLASHRGKTLNRKQWSFLSFLVALMTCYVLLSLLFAEYPIRQREEPRQDVSSRPVDAKIMPQKSLSHFLGHLFAGTSGKGKSVPPSRVLQLHRTEQFVKEEEEKSMVHRAEAIANWQAKVDALQSELKTMHAKVAKEEHLEADLWKLRKELSDLQQQRDPIMLQKEEQAGIKELIDDVTNEGVDDIKTVVMEQLPSASAWCFGDHRDDRLCRFKNLCYLPRRESFIFPKGNMTTLKNVPSDRDGALVDLTSLKDHSAFYFDYNEIDPNHAAFQHQKVRFIEKPTFIMSRFHPGNIMHTIHDDVLGLYHLLKEFAYNGHVAPGEPFALDHYIQFVDGHGVGEYAGIFQHFTANPILYRDSLHKDAETITCYRDAIVGNSKQANWYHYGFSSPQGPISNKTVDGHQVREVADYIMQKAGFDLNDPFHVPPSAKHFDRTKVISRLTRKQASGTTKHLVDEKDEAPIAGHVISIFSRLRNRKLVNEVEIAKALEAEHQLPVVFVRMEELTFLEQVAILRRSKLAMGMHGSILIMGMFLPRGASLIELYPYAVPSENYTPYRHMASLPGMALHYAAWENKHFENSISYPDNHYMLGGLGQLSPEERAKVIHTPTVPKHTCCTNPYWLFRVFQDTIGHVPELVALSRKLFNQQVVTLQQQINSNMIDVEPSAIDSESVKCHFLKDQKLTLTWNAPWNGAHPQGYSVWDHNSFREYLTTEPSLTLSIDPTKVTQVWIRPKKDEWRGKYTARIKCVPVGVIDNII